MAETAPPPKSPSYEPIDFSQVLAEEFEQVGLIDEISPNAQNDAEELFERAAERCPAALCLSGGGIRSATFNLGILQGLARAGLLENFHYLSTVSGGGYIGSWLTAWIHNNQGDHQRVFDQLPGQPAAEAPDHEPRPVQHLREYSNYLTPRLGLFSADTWTLAATYLRNLVLNWLVIIPFLAAVLMLPRIGAALVRQFSDFQGRVSLGVAFALLGLGFLCQGWAIAYMDRHRPSAGDRFRGTKPNDQGRFLRQCWLWLIVGAACLVAAWTRLRIEIAPALPAKAKWHLALQILVVLTILTSFVAALINVAFLNPQRQDKPRRGLLWRSAVAFMVSATVAASVLWWALKREILNPYAHARAYACLALPVVLLTFLLGGILFRGLTVRVSNDDDREWSARAGGWILLAALAYLAAAVLVLLVPSWIISLKPKFQAAVASAGGLAGILTALFAKSSRTPADDREQAKLSLTGRLRQIALALVAPLFVVALLVAIAFASNWLITNVYRQAKPLTTADFHREIILHPNPWYPLILLGIAGGLVLLSHVMSHYVSVNKFSLHAVYRLRLVRAYLGASRPDRDASPTLIPFTGLDKKDNPTLHQLNTYAPKGRRRLFHIINMALNLVGGAKLAWQQRKADSFTASPQHCGCPRLGYRSSELYGGGIPNPGQEARPSRAISLGTAMTISGAAASPNMGYHSSAPIAFLMTLFNVRLGAWLGNPGPAGSDTKYPTFGLAHPRLSLRPLVDEAFALTDDCHPYVYLSDGGHFENLGLYEMVRRRCRVIVVCDSGADPKCQFDDLGNALRKIYIDMGIVIRFDTGAIPIYSRKDQNRPTNLAAGKGYHALATILYVPADSPDAAQRNGRLIYVKASYYETGEPPHVTNYAKTCEDFPHESTADQFFSESQFESYRALGDYIAGHVTSDVKDAFTKCTTPNPSP